MNSRGRGRQKATQVTRTCFKNITVVCCLVQNVSLLLCTTELPVSSECSMNAARYLQVKSREDMRAHTLSPRHFLAVMYSTFSVAMPQLVRCCFPATKNWSCMLMCPWEDFSPLYLDMGEIHAEHTCTFVEQNLNKIFVLYIIFLKAELCASEKF